MAPCVSCILRIVLIVWITGITACASLPPPDDEVECKAEDCKMLEEIWM